MILARGRDVHVFNIVHVISSTTFPTKKIIRRYTSLRQDIEMSICTRIQTDTPVSPTDKDRKIEREGWKLSAYRMRSIMEANSCFPPPEKIKTTKK